MIIVLMFYNLGSFTNPYDAPPLLNPFLDYSERRSCVDDGLLMFWQRFNNGLSMFEQHVKAPHSCEAQSVVLQALSVSRHVALSALQRR